MESYQFDDISIVLNKKGSGEFSKVSYPIRYGRFAEIKTPDYVFQFNLKGEIKYIQGLTQSWPHPAEWLKRTVTNDWVYYSSGGYSGVYGFMGEYYIPCLSYPSNSIIFGNPFYNNAVMNAVKSLQKLMKKIKVIAPGSIPQVLKDFLFSVIESNEGLPNSGSKKLHGLIGDKLTVLPPDTRHVDYEVIPIIIADGCLYNCGFCKVKSGRDFALRDESNIIDQIKRLKGFYAGDISNYNAIFLGQHDALFAGAELLLFTAEKAYEVFEFAHSNLKGAYLFIFGSADSLINAKDTLFESLNNLPFYSYINIGLESADDRTLDKLKKPLQVETVCRAFTRMLDINRSYEKIEVTANFVFGCDLPLGHINSFIDLMVNRLDRFYSKGAIYLSPLFDGRTDDRKTRRNLLRKFNEVKTASLLPTFIYLIQRL
ncbi:MAG: radical SAM protein [Thermodesulfobacteriota bacterium]|nr:radical SAM protein [Thermodesulfobacteriota bacterium]